ncbi:hypothetical protein FNV43_RR02711 [Rhamnella rubrinervis]|uniref:Uncharacterized protein n=1 Tax=Rhamnella rubrinervis TaxID=2594499 RepID=A0A8K0HIH6_9ROSA|nr:hypothetical protein FNV43_RR02711 [Rhamnella rubrinervis]
MPAKKQDAKKTTSDSNKPVEATKQAESGEEMVEVGQKSIGRIRKGSPRTHSRQVTGEDAAGRWLMALSQKAHLQEGDHRRHPQEHQRHDRMRWSATKDRVTPTPDGRKVAKRTWRSPQRDEPMMEMPPRNPAEAPDSMPPKPSDFQ